MNCVLPRYGKVRTTFKTSLVIFLFLASAMQAQDKCGFDIILQKQMKENPAFKKMIDDQDQWIKEYIHKQGTIRRDQVAAVQYTIPVVVHVIHTGGAIGSIYNPTDASIQATINYLNQVYNGTYPGTEGVGDIEIQFALAIRDPNCNPTTGIDRVDGSGLTEYTSSGIKLSGATGASELSVKNLSRWDPSRYYNIWTVNMIDSKDGTSGSFVAGYAYFPGSPATLDGTIMLATQMQPNRKTLPHEIGHAFSLYHPFQGASGSTCPANADCTVDGDRVCDTDPVTQPVGFVCGTGTNPCTSTPFVINTEHNFMNYTNCATLFTAGQKARLLAGAASSSRIGLTSSYALSPVYPLTPFVSPVSASCTPATSATGLSGNFAGVMGISLASKTFTSNTARNDGGYNNNTGDCHKLIQLQRGSTYTIDVSLLGANAEQMKGWIDYNGNGIFDNVSEQVISFYESSAPAPGRGNITASAAFTVPVSAVINTVLRLRLLEDLSDIHGVPLLSNACFNPVYGQAEDYPIYLLPAGALPLTLLDFTGIADNRDVLLGWETTAENNTDRFIVQRSTDNLSFVDISQQPARGNNNQITKYSYRDTKPGEGKWSYRLKMVDLDNRYQFSATVSVNIGSINNATSSLVQNPVNAYMDLRLQNNKTSKSLTIFDISGRKVIEKKAAADVSLYRIHEVSTLRPGVYLLEIRSGSVRELIKFIKN